MKKILLYSILLLTLSTNMQAQQYVRELDQKTDKPLLRGAITFGDLLKESAYTWMKESYEPETSAVAKIEKLIPKYRLVVFAGTWCEDTQLLLPQLYQTLKDVHFNFNALEMYGVNRAKEGLDAEHLIYNIERVPTIIIMDRFREVGRIVENVNESIEKDILTILEGDQ